MDEKSADMPCHVKLGDWAAVGELARDVRTEVFLVEQKVPVELEWDAMDAVSLHAIASDSAGIVVGTGRLLPDGHIGRMAVRRSARGRGIGGAILSVLMQAARQRALGEVRLNAQTYAESFYAQFGFVREGDEFLDAGIPHVHMRCRFA
jgi:predicted GNAT family N-acyltransferase